MESSLFPCCRCSSQKGEALFHMTEETMTMIARIINFFNKREENKGEREERAQEIAERTVPKISDPLYHFICSSNRSLTVAFHNLFTVGAPV